MIVDSSAIQAKAGASAKIKADIDAFIAAGGEIVQYDTRRRTVDSHLNLRISENGSTRKRVVKEGKCTVCGKAFLYQPRGKKRVTCGSSECTRENNRRQVAKNNQKVREAAA